MKVLEKVSKALSRNYGIKVEFKGSKAYTDYKKIVLPILPENVDKTDEAKIRGYCDHEIGHLLFSNPEITKLAATYGAKVRNVRQALEDFRIEKDIAGKYAGTKSNMERTAQLLVNQNDHGDMSHIMTKLWVEGRRKINGYTFDLPSYENDVKAAFGNDVFDRMKAMGSGRENAIDALKLAIEMVKDYERQRQNQPEPPQQDLPEKQHGPQQPSKNDEEQDPGQSDDAGGNGNEDESGSNNDGSDSDGFDDEGEEKAEQQEHSSSSNESDQVESDEENHTSSNDSSDEENGSESASDSSDDGQTGNEGDALDGDEGDRHNFEEEDDAAVNECSSGTLTETALNDDLGEWENAMDSLQKKIERLSEQALDDGACLPYSKDFDQVKFVKEGRTLGYFNQYKRNLGPLAAERSRISRMFLARQACRWNFDLEEGRIDTRRLSSVKAGNRSVFKELHVSNDMDTAITMLCDCSGSMGVQRVNDVMTAVVFMLETLKTSSIKMEVLGYTTGSKIQGAPWMGRELYKWTRVERLMTYVFKEFSEPYNRTVKLRISGAPYVKKNNNVDADSLLVAYERMAKQPQRRKIIFVLSDGYPNSAGNNAKKNRQLIDTVKKLEKIGIEVVGIGMGETAKAEQFYPKHIRLESTKQIVSTMHSELKRVLKVKK